MEKERKTRLSGVDWAIILFTLLLVVGGAFFAYRFFIGTENAITISYRICLSALPGEDSGGSWRNRLTVGAPVYSENGTAFLGNLTAVEIREHKDVMLLENEIKTVTVPQKYDVLVTVKAQATLQAGNGFRVSDIRIAAGGIGTFRIGSYLARYAKIYSVRAGEG